MNNCPQSFARNLYYHPLSSIFLDLYPCVHPNNPCKSVCVYPCICCVSLLLCPFDFNPCKSVCVYPCICCVSLCYVHLIFVTDFSPSPP